MWGELKFDEFLKALVVQGVVAHGDVFDEVVGEVNS